jgi:hypothetical protein
MWSQILRERPSIGPDKKETERASHLFPRGQNKKASSGFLALMNRLFPLRLILTKLRSSWPTRRPMAGKAQSFFSFIGGGDKWNNFFSPGALAPGLSVSTDRGAIRSNG